MGSGVEREFFELCAQQLVRTNDPSQHTHHTDVSANTAECVTPAAVEAPELPQGLVAHKARQRNP